ncbi:MAG: hypothetical protein WBF75_08930 [Pseudonocardiaceae bacterium]
MDGRPQVPAEERQAVLDADAIYVAAAERHATALLTADARIERSGASITCKIITVGPSTPPAPG